MEREQFARRRLHGPIETAWQSSLQSNRLVHQSHPPLSRPSRDFPVPILIASGVQRAQAGQFDEAERRLTSALLCGGAAPVRELAGLRLLQRRWLEVGELATAASAVDPMDEDAWQLLATSRFLYRTIPKARSRHGIASSSFLASNKTPNEVHATEPAPSTYSRRAAARCSGRPQQPEHRVHVDLWDAARCPERMRRSRREASRRSPNLARASCCPAGRGAARVDRFTASDAHATATKQANSTSPISYRAATLSSRPQGLHCQRDELRQGRRHRQPPCPRQPNARDEGGEGAARCCAHAASRRSRSRDFT